MDKDKIIKGFDKYFNIHLNHFIHGNVTSNYETFVINFWSKGSIYNIRITSKNGSYIFDYIENNFVGFKNETIAYLKNNQTNFLEDSLNIVIYHNQIKIGFYVCYGLTCPIKLESYVKRSGVVPYFILDNIEYLILGIKVYIEGNVWSDLGGGCKSSLNELSYDCANRELLEESLGLLKPNNNITHIFGTEIIGSVWNPKLKKYIPGYKINQLIYFIDYTDQLVTRTTDTMLLYDITKKYKELMIKHKNPELENIFIIPYNSFKLLPKELLAESLRELKGLLPNSLRD